MIYFILVPLLVLIGLVFNKQIKKYQYFIYIVATAIAIGTAVVEELNFVNAGFLGLSFFIVVMFTGALARSKFKNKLLKIRTQYSIIGFLLISSHAIPFTLYSLDEGLVFKHIVIPIGILNYLVFIPLFILSFQLVKKQIGFKLWKKINQFAYIGYLLVFLHLYLQANSRQSFYLALFIIYTVFRLINLILSKKVTRKA